MKKIVLFDGQCNFCNKSVQFIIKRDPRRKFQFASLQSPIGQNLLHDYKVKPSIDSLVLITGKKAYIKSSAALRISGDLRGLWKLLYLFLIIPRPFRNFIYDQFAQSRYKWFGQKQTCILYKEADRRRFLQ